jgi:hypothetical protein
MGSRAVIPDVAEQRSGHLMKPWRYPGKQSEILDHRFRGNDTEQSPLKVCGQPYAIRFQFGDSTTAVDQLEKNKEY